jgi:hypothetical protein
VAAPDLQQSWWTFSPQASLECHFVASVVVVVVADVVVVVADVVVALPTTKLRSAIVLATPPLLKFFDRPNL